MKRTLVSIVMLGVAVGAPAFAQPQHRHLGSGAPSPDIINRNDPIHDPAARDTHYNPYYDYYAWPPGWYHGRPSPYAQYDQNGRLFDANLPDRP